jgi:predicted site-specific integrase-resolvase
MHYLNVSELATRWRISTKTLERWRCQGTGPVYLKLQGRVLYRMHDIEAYEMRRLKPRPVTTVQRSAS